MYSPDEKEGKWRKWRIVMNQWWNLVEEEINNTIAHNFPHMVPFLENNKHKQNGNKNEYDYQPDRGRWRFQAFVRVHRHVEWASAPSHISPAPWVIFRWKQTMIIKGRYKRRYFDDRTHLFTSRISAERETTSQQTTTNHTDTMGRYFHNKISNSYVWMLVTMFLRCRASLKARLASRSSGKYTILLSSALCKEKNSKRCWGEKII